MRKRASMSLLASAGVLTGLAAAVMLDAASASGCAPEHPRSGQNLAHTGPCANIDEITQLFAREEAAGKAARVNRAKAEGPVLAVLKGDD